MKMYRDYLKERLGDEMVDREEGFATYRFIEDNGSSAVYIIDLYVRPDFRKTKIASDMSDQIVDIAKKRGCKYLIGTVSSIAANKTESMKVLLAYGMSFYKCDKDGIIFRKEI